MSHALRFHARDCWAWDVARLPLLLLGLALTAAPAAGAPAPGPDNELSRDGGSAEVRFPTPARHAIVRQPPGPGQGLYGTGAVIVHPQAPGRALTVVRVEPNHLLVREGASGPPQVLRPGDLVPGCPGWTVGGIVLSYHIIVGPALGGSLSGRFPA